jgi:hypothetical protein
MLPDVEQAVTKYIELTRRHARHTLEVVAPAIAALRLAEADNKAINDSLHSASERLREVLHVAAAKHEAEGAKAEPATEASARRRRG